MTRRLLAWTLFGAIAFCSLAPTTPSSDDETNAVAPTGVPHRHTTKRKHRPPAKEKEPQEVQPPPAVPGGAPATSAVSVIVVNAHSGDVLYEKNPDQLRAPASTTKLLTALIVAESGDLDRDVTVEMIDTLAEPVKLNIRPGEHYRRIDLLRALLVKSPNDVARCLARDNAGSVVAFAERMNQRAHELGAGNSHFINPNGLPVTGQYTTARDLSTIARAAYANGIIRSIVCLPQLTFRFASGRTRELENTNKLLRQLPYCNGMKTGYTEAAGKCLIASGTRPGKDIIVVVLGDTSGRVWRDAGALLDVGPVEFGRMNDWFAEQVQALRARSLDRHLREVAGAQGSTIEFAGNRLINFSANDYLGLANDPTLCEAATAAIAQFGVGAGASRLISGTQSPHVELERALAKWKGTGAAISFSNRARSFIYSTASSPAIAAAGRAAVEFLASPPGEERRLLLRERIKLMQKSLPIDGQTTSKPTFRAGGSAIFPWLMGDEQRAIDLAKALRDEGFFVPAIRYPTLAKGAARLRITVTAAHTEEQIRSLCEALARFGSNL